MNDNFNEPLLDAAARFGFSVGRTAQFAEDLRKILEEIKDYHDHGKPHPKCLIVEAQRLARELKATTELAAEVFEELKLATAG